ncbi:MAG: hypothetical protein ACOYKJ_06190 [Candidatus Howiella sp.]|jgi:hypothetical protein
MKGSSIFKILALTATAAGVAAWYKRKKAKEEQLVLEFDLTEDDAAVAAEAVKAAETAEANTTIPAGEESATALEESEEAE